MYVIRLNIFIPFKQAIIMVLLQTHFMKSYFNELTNFKRIIQDNITKGIFMVYSVHSSTFVYTPINITSISINIIIFIRIISKFMLIRFQKALYNVHSGI